MIVAPSQAVLILFDKYNHIVENISEQLKKLEPDTPQYEEVLLLLVHAKNALQELKELYLSGAQTPEQKEKLSVLMQDDVLKSYEISYDYQVINNDPSRRYFESHLSYETAKTHFKELSLAELTKHRDFLLQRVKSECKPEELAALQGTFDETQFTSRHAKDKAAQEGKSSPSTPDFGPAEFADAIFAIEHSSLYETFSAEDKEKLICMMQSCYLAVINVTLHNDSLPFSDLTKRAPYDATSRGRKLKTNDDITQLDVQTHVAGLMKGFMPISRNDILYREEGFKYLKPADRCYFDDRAAFIVKTFESALNTFSCSISGTTLCQIKMLTQAAIEGRLQFDDVNKLKNFIRGFISAVQFHSGGHTMIEFCSVLALPEVQAFFNEHVPGFDEINVGTLFLHDNEEAFNNAIKDSIEYNQMLIKQSTLHNEIHQLVKETREAEADAGVVKTPLLKPSEISARFKQHITSMKHSAVKTDATHEEDGNYPSRQNHPLEPL